MVSELLDAGAESAQNLAKGMTSANPFVAFVLIVIVLLLGWFVWSNQELQSQLIQMKVQDVETGHDAGQRQKEMTAQLEDMEVRFKAARDETERRFRALVESDKEQHIENQGVVRGLNEKLDLIISNQQIRGAIRRGQGVEK